jgi:hypothetical protein
MITVNRPTDKPADAEGHFGKKNIRFLLYFTEKTSLMKLNIVKCLYILDSWTGAVNVEMLSQKQWRPHQRLQLVWQQFLILSRKWSFIGEDVNMCSDGAPDMSGSPYVFMTLVKEKNSSITRTHYAHTSLAYSAKRPQLFLPQI